jgi:hypothetical protein
MKYLVAAFFFLSIFAVASQASEGAGFARGASRAASDEFLTLKQKQTVLQAIDNVCGDTWCEGDNSYRFESIDCSSREGRCQVGIRIVPPGKAEIGARCSYAAHAYSDLVDDQETFVTLNDKFYSSLTDCIGDAEE